MHRPPSRIKGKDKEWKERPGGRGKQGVRRVVEWKKGSWGDENWGGNEVGRMIPNCENTLIIV